MDRAIDGPPASVVVHPACGGHPPGILGTRWRGALGISYNLRTLGCPRVAWSVQTSEERGPGGMRSRARPSRNCANEPRPGDRPTQTARTNPGPAPVNCANEPNLGRIGQSVPNPWSMASVERERESPACAIGLSTSSPGKAGSERRQNKMHRTNPGPTLRGGSRGGSPARITCCDERTQPPSPNREPAPNKPPDVWRRFCPRSGRGDSP
jgi:hypothetical protein